MKTQCQSRMKTLLRSLTTRLSQPLLLLGLVALLFLALNAGAATIKISQEPVSSTIKGADIFLIDSSNGDGTYTTKTVSFANLGLSGMSTTFVTNLYVNLEYVTNQYVTFNYVQNEYVTNQYVTTSYTTNLYVTTEIATNLTVTQVFKGNTSFITNLTIVSPGSLTNLNLTPNSLLLSDPNDAVTSLANGGAHTFPEGTTPPAFRLLQGNDFKDTTSLAPTVPNGTNFIIDLSALVYQGFHCSNNVNFMFVTNGPGASSIRFDPNGGDRVLTFPTNWMFLRTNFLTRSGAFWTYTLTNALNGANNTREGILSVWSDENTGSQSNVFALFQQAP